MTGKYVLAEGPTVFTQYPRADYGDNAVMSSAPSIEQILETYQGCSENLQLASSCMIWAIALNAFVTILVAVLIVKLFTVWNES